VEFLGLEGSQLRVRLLASIAIALLALAGTTVLLWRGSRPVSPTPVESPSNRGVKASLVVTGVGELIKATSKGLFRSVDSGRTWEPMPLPPGLAPSGLTSLAVDPDRPSVIYAAGFNAGVILSEDGGTSWRRVATGLPSLDVEALAMHAFRRETLFVSVRRKGVYRTENGGRQWERMDGGPPAQSVLALAHSPLEGSMNTGWLYAGAVDGPYLSMDCF